MQSVLKYFCIMVFYHLFFVAMQLPGLAVVFRLHITNDYCNILRRHIRGVRKCLGHFFYNSSFLLYRPREHIYLYYWHEITLLILYIYRIKNSIIYCVKQC